MILDNFVPNFESRQHALNYWRKKLENLELKILSLLRERAEIKAKIKFLDKNE